MKDIKGITLIALVITIIILLIIAGVSIKLFTGENGIFQKANASANKYSIEEDKENIGFEFAEYLANNAENKMQTQTFAEFLFNKGFDIRYDDETHYNAKLVIRKRIYELNQNGEMNYIGKE